ncbi:MAG TPA: sodium/solute symporter [Tepidisphaeraceae bacterium]|jgi:SSS family solute:Na+ symporter|nr:sodium/solute symporter [Tepidisphaeraceae bacterium]
MRLTHLDFAIFLAYMLAILGIGFWAARRGKQTKRDYFLAGDKLPWWMIGGSIVAANISSHQLIGSMGVAYSRGFVAMVTEWGMILVGLNALLWIFLPFYLRNGFYTVPEFLLRRFGPGVRTLYAVLILLTYLLVEIGAVLYLGGLSLYALVGIPVAYSIVILAVVTGAYTITGGLRAVVWTEMVQLIVLLCGGAALSVATIHATGGVSAVIASSKDWHLLLPASDPDFPWTMYLGGTLCISIFYAAANQFIVQRALAAKDEWNARMGIVFTDYLKFLIPIIIIVPGMMAPKLLPNLARADLVFPTLVQTLLPTGLIGLVMAGLIAAVMGHMSGAVNSVATIATIDFYMPWKRWRDAGQLGETSDAQAVAFGRWFGVGAILMGIVCAMLLTQHSKKPIFLYLLNAYGYFTPGIATMFLLGILWKRTTNAGALAAGFLTIPLSLALEWKFPRLAFQNRTGIVFWTCMVTCAAVSLCGKPRSDVELEGLIWTRDSLRMPMAEREKYRGLRRPVIWWGIITAVVLYFYIRFA